MPVMLGLGRHTDIGFWLAFVALCYMLCSELVASEALESSFEWKWDSTLQRHATRVSDRDEMKVVSRETRVLIVHGSPWITSEDLAPFKELQIISFKGGSIDTAAISALRSVPTLEAVYFEETSLAAFGIDGLKPFPIEVLSLSHIGSPSEPSVTSAQAAWLLNCFPPKRFRFRYMGLADEDEAAGIDRLLTVVRSKAVERIDLTQCFSIPSKLSLEKLLRDNSALTELQLEYLGATAIVFSALEAGVSLKAINLRGCAGATDEVVRTIGRLPKLTHLDISGCLSLTDDGFASLKDSRIKHLAWGHIYGDDLEKVRTTRRAFVAIAEMNELSSLILSLNGLVTGEALRLLATGLSKSLLVLKLSKCPQLKSADVLEISQFKLLEVLDLSIGSENSPNLTSSAIEKLAGALPSLKELYLAYQGRLDDATIEHIAKNLTTLRCLSLYACNRISGEKLVNLAIAGELRWLDVSRITLTDEQLLKLAQFPALRELHVGPMTITRATAQKLGGLEKELEIVGLIVVE